jgi:hypothetical protein
METICWLFRVAESMDWTMDHNEEAKRSCMQNTNAEIGKLKVVQFDRLKCYTGPTRESWLAEDEPQEETAILEIEEEAIFPQE